MNLLIVAVWTNRKQQQSAGVGSCFFFFFFWKTQHGSTAYYYCFRKPLFLESAKQQIWKWTMNVHFHRNVHTNPSQVSKCIGNIGQICFCAVCKWPTYISPFCFCKPKIQILAQALQPPFHPQLYLKCN